MEARDGTKRTLNWTGSPVQLPEPGEADQPTCSTTVETTDATVPAPDLLAPLQAHRAARAWLPAAPLGDAGSGEAGIDVPAAPAPPVEGSGPVRADTNAAGEAGAGMCGGRLGA